MSVISVQNDYDFYISEIEYFNEREANPEWRIDGLVYHNFYIIAFCKSGEAIYRFNGTEHTVRKGDLLFFPKGLVRSAHSNPDNPWSFYTITFDVRFQNEQARELFDRFDYVIRSPQLYKLQTIFTEFNQVWTGKRNGFTIQCKSLIMNILYAMIRERDRQTHGSAHYNAIEQTTNHILAHYTDHFSIAELARQTGLSPSHFRLLFKKITGMTAVQYQNHIRINKAKDLLMSGECNVTEAALSVGFQDIYYFSRLFKQLTGESPSRYIRG
ncbi:helix-turn-helix transcriptional regulator [Paenibacillus sp. GYB003]|uniref:helix-turn-helix transcriptional regulator n=1 Tax=Paenibacillus sp. GYB003 TaxID=2994392 RepID=UPI002F96860A